MGSAGMEAPEFLSQKSLKPKTTTDLDTNPVLSDISLPAKLEVSNTDEHESTSTNNRPPHTLESCEDFHGLEPVLHESQNGVSPRNSKGMASKVHSEGTPSNRKSMGLELHSGIGNSNQQLRPYSIPLASSARTKRSSIYHMKTPNAIPIRAPSHRSTHFEGDDRTSVKSISSSLTASFSKSFLFGFYHNYKNGSKASKSVLSKEYWMKDESAKDCFSCAKPFTTFRRKHHCRICGQIFCGNCTFLIDGGKFQHDGKMRVCRNCHTDVDTLEDSSDESSAEEHEESTNEDQVESSLDQRLPSTDVLILEDDEVQSILADKKGAQVFRSTPPPPPKMAIPATRQGGSLEISVPSRSSPSSRGDASRHWRSMRDVYTIRDVDILPPYTIDTKGSRGSHGHVSALSSQAHEAHIPHLKHSMSSFAPNGGNNEVYKQPSRSPSSVIANLSNNDFKFEFNYRTKNFQDYLNGNNSRNSRTEQTHINRSESSPILPSHQEDTIIDNESGISDDGSEDERSMSLYAALNDSHQDQHYMRPMRNTTKSFQRAQASLQRMKSRGKFKGRSHASNSVVRKQFEFFNQSSPFLKPALNNDEDYFNLNESSLCLERPHPRNDASTGSRDMRRIISTASVLRLKSQESKSELSDVAQLHMNALLNQVLKDQDVEDLNEWIEVFKSILSSLQGIELDARNMNGLDFKQYYIKIKRIGGSFISNSRFVNGVVYSKNIPLKSMPRCLTNPRILLIMFPLEYQKNENHFMSLDSIMAQEEEYLRKLVLRLKSLNPDVVLVGANVSGFALKLMNDAGILVQFNMKPQVMERIAKLTEASIAITVDKLATSVKLGTCASFQVRTFCYGNLVKSYTFLEGCKASLGGTILLRGSSFDVLQKIKDITEFMAYAVFSLKLESSFFNDNFLQLSVELYKQSHKQQLESAAPQYFADFIEKFHQRILSVSPTVEFPMPFLLRKARELESELIRKESESKDLAATSTNSNSDLEKTIQDLGLESALTNQDFKNLVKFVHKKDVEDLKARFKWRSRQWELSYALSKNMLGTGTHQTIHVLYSMISKKTATPCVGPQLVSIDYFWDTDISIGQFIENIVATANCTCLHGCGGILLDHYRSYVHGTGKVDVLIERFQSRLPSLKNILLTWSYCKECSSSTPILQMSKKTWNYSFGKYLELLFWSRGEGIKTIGNCNHDFAKDHVKYFSYDDLMVRMEYSNVDVHELITPRSQISWKPNIDIKLKVELYYQILEKINNFYASVSDRLLRIKLDSMSSDRAVAAEGKIEELKKRVLKEKEILIDLTESIYRNTPGDQHLPLNATIRSLHDNAAGWDSEFSEFGKTFLPSENDIARITAIQLKKLFTDAAKTDQEQITLTEKLTTSDATQQKAHETGSDVTKNEIANDKRLSNMFEGSTTIGKLGSLYQDRSETFKEAHRPSITHRQTTPNIKKINTRDNSAILPKDDILIGSKKKVQGSTSDVRPSLDILTARPPIDLSDSVAKNSNSLRSLSNGSGGSFNSLHSKEYGSGSKVGQLANFFDQIHFDALSKEFELQREFERLQLNKNKYKALRVEPSKPIVEIYKNAKDAVDGPLHTDSRRKKLPFANGRQEWKNITNASKSHCSSNDELENKLEHSIHQWGERILRKEDKSVSDEGSTSENLTEKHESGEALSPVVTPAAAKMHKLDPESQPEKSSLMKTLANFWADRSATLWKSLDYPTASTEHIFVDSPVIIREDEPCSLISFCLSSSDYLQKMRVSNSSEGEKNGSNRAEPHNSTPCGTNAQGISEGGEANESLLSNDTAANKNSSLQNKESSTESAPEPREDTKTDGNDVENSNTGETEETNSEKIMTKKTAMHLRYQFQDGSSVMSCKIFFAEQFDAFRKTCSCEENFIQSLSRCVKWDSSGGKSGSAFLKTLDDRFVIKELSHTELDSFIKFAPSYFEYMAQAMFHDLPTALAKVFGLYQIQTKNSDSGKSFKMDVIIMENLFYDKKTSRIFDLKGSMRNRHVKQTGKENEVLLDENMVEYIYESPIFVREYDKKLLRASLWNDTLFLAKMNVMDYSLVIGVDNNNHTLTVGIIDFIRTFTWDKKLESWVKERGFVGGSTKEPTVVTPRQYKNRFREAMERYILMVPDPWFQEIHD
ncbi:1-phosphatidylinositol-3-phosphate 5-kinase [Lachancea thermotolerans CBS 6340]|uniref:1-phosphatidylinositol-3-phosphate 5-kinase n=1 Tax=Lachancea thermotolerans (strain ATCC 56472 / CBS 6340 / NRRL Y-8284) TaxID=559295 RepID=C5E3E8_LACTC|nr:KLTH0H12804p [Lachancea thermotolerans CBS 6340]CAR30559.1 KLTH0H12804p [Lachancea thermotolerans CBS 6340]